MQMGKPDSSATSLTSNLLSPALLCLYIVPSADSLLADWYVSPLAPQNLPSAGGNKLGAVFILGTHFSSPRGHREELEALVRLAE